MTYMLAAIGGSVLSFAGAFFSLWANSGNSVGLSISVGASGAIFGLIGLIIGNKVFRRNSSAPALNVDLNSLLFIVGVNLFLGFSINSVGAGVAINNWAHIGGLITGFLLGGFLDTKNTFDQPNWKRVFEIVLFGICALLFVVAWIFNLFSIIGFSTGLFT